MKILAPLLLLLAGCTSTVQEFPPEMVLAWPKPMMECEITSIEVLSDGRVVMSYTDNINIALCERDMFRYIKDLSSMVCTHQPTDNNCKGK